MMYNLSVHQQLGKMVGVSDDVNEYAMALRDTEDKLRRCPKRVRPGQASGSLRGRGRAEGLTHLGSPGQSIEDICPCLCLWGLSQQFFLSPPPPWPHHINEKGG